MPTKSVHKWMSDEMARLSTKFARYKPSCNGYNRIQPVLLSRSVTQMLNNPLPVEDQIGSTMTAASQQQPQQKQQQAHGRPKGVLSRSEAEWEEVYPTVQFGRSEHCEADGKKAERKFAYYRNCSTRII
ncbi:uncharacterized protein LOC126752137 [Bactrocera neohumeralis]|uniref:uncharacterized protein LOC126752137 n=1 Tax=Bactrocera neohumeralis TaxID=98809 RepID=UPI00059747CD|nr:uncharacterized protein LOC126752137 [Bactrocera neohumeralis]